MTTLNQRILEAEQRRRSALDAERQVQEAIITPRQIAEAAERELVELYAQERREKFEAAFVTYTAILAENDAAVRELQIALTALDIRAALQRAAELEQNYKATIEFIRGAMAILVPEFDEAATAAREAFGDMRHGPQADHESYMAYAVRYGRELKRFTKPLPPQCVYAQFIAGKTGEDLNIAMGIVFALTGMTMFVPPNYDQRAEADAIAVKHFNF